jgi:hypothetical protein
MIKVLMGQLMIKVHDGAAPTFVENIAAPRQTRDMTLVGDDREIIATRDTIFLVVKLPSTGTADATTSDLPTIRSVAEVNKSVTSPPVATADGDSPAVPPFRFEQFPTNPNL